MTDVAGNISSGLDRAQHMKSQNELISGRTFYSRPENKYELMSISCRGVMLNMENCQIYSLFSVYGVFKNIYLPLSPSLYCCLNKRAHLAVDSTAFSRSTLEDLGKILILKTTGNFWSMGRKW